MSVQGSPIAELALRLKLPSIYADPLFAKAGGLMSYGARTLIAYSRISLPTSIRFSSAKPADLPVEQPSKFELIINLKTAKALGLDIPPNRYSGLGGECSAWIFCRVSRAIDPRFCKPKVLADQGLPRGGLCPARDKPYSAATRRQPMHPRRRNPGLRP